MSADDMQNFRQLLSNNGYRCTPARVATFRLLVNPEPQSISQLLARAKGQVDRVSVYRNLDVFEKLGIVHRIYVGWKYKVELSDEFIAHHHHLSCLSCGSVTDIQDEQHIDDFIKQITQTFGFTARRHQFEIDGYCRKCRVSDD